MIKYFINYSSNGFKKSQEYGLESAEKLGFIVKGYTEKDIDLDFMKKNESILKQVRGAGYWLWKPYIILNMLNKMSDGDYLIYMDSGANLISEPDIYLNLINEKGILAFSMVQKTSKWTKGDCFYSVNGKDNLYNFSDTNQLQATYIFFRKCQSAIDFVSKWLELCTNENCITDIPNVYAQNMTDFIDHRHDQSVFSLLCYNNDIMYIPQIDQYCIEHNIPIDRKIVNRHGIRI
jgi:hypothetical protein